VAHKIHRLLAKACVETLEAVFRDGIVADRAVARVLGSQPGWGSRDRGFVAETIYEVVRWRRRLALLAGSDDFWSLAGMQWALKDFPRPEWARWAEVPESVREERVLSLTDAPRAVRESVSDELDALCASELGSQWDVELAALNQAAPVFLRINPLRSSLKAAEEELASHGLSAVEVAGAPLALKVEGGRSIPAGLKNSGRMEIQDAGSQQVAPFLQVEPGHRVVDACAGTGGKTLHLAALMEGRGDLRALDVDEARLSTLEARAKRAGVKVKTAKITPGVLTKLDAWADRVLIDAPCSGSGTLRRQADLKYRITPEWVAQTQALQRALLAKFSRLVQPGGKLVYATCSILPSENEKQAEWFSKEHPAFTFDGECRISPAATGWDGFYMARWTRTPGD
jgi:16S rRNA (cytosine967-C5)-methyltransferase